MNDDFFSPQSFFRSYASGGDKNEMPPRVILSLPRALSFLKFASGAQKCVKIVVLMSTHAKNLLRHLDMIYFVGNRYVRTLKTALAAILLVPSKELIMKYTKP